VSNACHSRVLPRGVWHESQERHQNGQYISLGNHGSTKKHTSLSFNHVQERILIEASLASGNHHLDLTPRSESFSIMDCTRKELSETPRLSFASVCQICSGSSRIFRNYDRHVSPGGYLDATQVSWVSPNGNRFRNHDDYAFFVSTTGETRQTSTGPLCSPFDLTRLYVSPSLLLWCRVPTEALEPTQGGTPISLGRVQEPINTHPQN
jgi:hypothetical protein